MESMETVMTATTAQGCVNVTMVLEAQAVSCVKAITLGQTAQVTRAKRFKNCEFFLNSSIPCQWVLVKLTSKSVNTTVGIIIQMEHYTNKGSRFKVNKIASRNYH